MSDTRDGGAGANIVSDMDEHGQLRQTVLRFAKEAVAQHSSEYKISEYIKTQLDESDSPCWHCIVGSNYKVHCSYVAKTFMFFYIGKRAITVYKTPF